MIKKKEPVNKESKKVDFIIDATNVCSWHKININNQSKNADYSTSLNVILKLANVLAEKKKTFKCIFDASTPYKLPDEEQEIYQHLLQVFERAFYQVTGGQRADDWVLALGDKFGSKIISTDRFRDFQDRYKWLNNEDDRLVKGGILDMMDELTIVLPSLKITETIDGTSNQLFIQLAQKMGLESKLSFKASGKIKSYNSVNQYGFIYIAETNEEVYFKQSEFKIVPDINVDFELFRDGDKIFAKNIVPTGLSLNEQEQQSSQESKNTKNTAKPSANNNKHPEIVTPAIIEEEIDEDEEVMEGEIQWFNIEKGFGLISQLEGIGSYMFRLDNIDDENLDPQPQTKVSFIIRTRNAKSYAYNVRQWIEKVAAAPVVATPAPTETSKKQTSNDDFKNKICTILPQLNIRLKGKINNIKGNYGFIGVENSETALFFKFEDKLSIKAGDKVSFKLDVNDHGILAVDIIAEPKVPKTPTNQENNKPQSKKAEVEEVVPQQPQPQKAKADAPQKVADANKPETPKQVNTQKQQQQATAKEETQEIAQKPAPKQNNVPPVEKPKMEQPTPKVEAPKAIEKVEEVAKVQSSKETPTRKGPARIAAEKTEVANTLEFLPGEKLSKLQEFEARTNAPVAQKVNAPKVENKKVETPKVENKKAEAPKVESKKVETPKVENKKVETPKVENKKVETPKVESKKAEAPKTEIKKAPENTEAVDTPKNTAKVANKKATAKKTTAAKGKETKRGTKTNDAKDLETTTIVE